VKTQIVNANIVLDGEVLEDGVIRFDGGVIEYVGRTRDSGYSTVDAEGEYLLPGFIDIHCHGGNGYDFMDAAEEEMLEISRFHLSHGTTTLVPTTMTDRWEAIRASLDTFASIPEDKRLTLHGVHLEGPWLNPLQCGAQSKDKMEKPSLDRLCSVLSDYPFIERVTLAPELDTEYEVGRACARYGIIASVGHSDADFDTVTEAVENGYTLMTHLYSGMKGTWRESAYRIAGAVEAGLYDDRLYVEVIADGKHLPNGLLKLIYKCKGADRIALITDAMRGAGLPAGAEPILGRAADGVATVIEDGVAKLPDRQSFAGSVATADRLLRTMLSLGIPVTECSKMLSKTPAAIMGYTDRGSLEVGKRADILLLDKKYNIKELFLKGERYVS